MVQNSLRDPSHRKDGIRWRGNERQRTDVALRRRCRRHPRVSRSSFVLLVTSRFRPCRARDAKESEHGDRSGHLRRRRDADVLTATQPGAYFADAPTSQLLSGIQDGIQVSRELREVCPIRSTHFDLEITCRSDRDRQLERIL